MKRSLRGWKVHSDLLEIISSFSNARNFPSITVNWVGRKKLSAHVEVESNCLTIALTTLLLELLHSIFEAIALPSVPV
jgi:hypothetical protein